MLLSVWMPPALKRDVKRLAAAERLPLSRFCCGILRLGIARYFELADERLAAPLRAAMRDVFPEGEHFPPMPELIRKKYEHETASR